MSRVGQSNAAAAPARGGMSAFNSSSGHGPVAVAVKGGMASASAVSGGVMPMSVAGVGAPLASIHSGVRPPTGSGGGVRPPTASLLPPGSRGGLRPPTGRIPTAMIQQMNIAPLNTNVHVEARPVTQQGLTGMRTQPLGPARQIADKSYYLTELRNKLTDIDNELNRLRNDIDSMNKNSEMHRQYQKKYESMLKEMRTLEGELADYNLTLDKLRSHADIAEIRALYERVRQKNNYERAGVDDLFMKSMTAEKAVKEMEEKMSDIHNAAAARLSSLGEEKMSEYKELQEESAYLSNAISEKDNRIAELDNAIGHYSEQMKSEAFSLQQKGINLKKEHRALMNSYTEMSEELNSALSPADVKDKLMKKIKTCNDEVSEMEKAMKKLEKEIDSLHEQIRQRENEVSEGKKHAAKSKKYEAVYERERKMQEFIDSYPQLKKEEIEKKFKSKETIVALLKHISKGLQLQSALPDADKFAELKSELSFKEEKMKSSASTLQTLNKELAKRKEELEKIDSLDEKIQLELTQLNDKMAKMDDELKSFKTEDEVKVDAMEKKKQLLKDKQDTKKVRDALKQQVSLLSTDFEKRNKELMANEITKRFEAMEQRLRTYAQTVFTLQEYISSRKRESDYHAIKTDVLALIKDLNDMHIANAAQMHAMQNQTHTQNQTAIGGMGIGMGMGMGMQMGTQFGIR